MMKKNDLTAFMISMEMEKRQILKTVKRVQAKTNHAGNKIKLQFQKMKMILCLRQKDVGMIPLEMEILRTLMGWILNGEIEEKMLE